MSDMDNKLDMILNTIVKFKEEFCAYKSESNEKLDRIEATLSRIESNQPEDIIGMLKQINNKIDERDSEIQALNKRVFKVESRIERLTQL